MWRKHPKTPTSLAEKKEAIKALRAERKPTFQRQSPSVYIPPPCMDYRQYAFLPSKVACNPGVRGAFNGLSHPQESAPAIGRRKEHSRRSVQNSHHESPKLKEVEFDPVVEFPLPAVPAEVFDVGAADCEYHALLTV
eukprot:260421-Amphidinium_carterae.1